MNPGIAEEVIWSPSGLKPSGPPGKTVVRTLGLVVIPSVVGRLPVLPNSWYLLLRVFSFLCVLPASQA